LTEINVGTEAVVVVIIPAEAEDVEMEMGGVSKPQPMAMVSKGTLTSNGVMMALAPAAAAQDMSARNAIFG
jgi:hypothetical protein